jgi:CheY-like chemotaxis protein
MPRILAIEPEPDRGVLLRDLVRESLDTDVVIAASTADAIEAMREARPDLILTSMLLSAAEEQDLVAHLRATPSVRHLPVLTVPVVTDLSAAQTRSSGLFSRLLRRRQPQVFPAYNFNAVIARIEEALEQSKIAAAQTAAMAAQIDEEIAVEQIATESVVERPLPAAFDPAFVSDGSQKRPRRWALSELPWLSSIRTSWGQHLRLLNISSNGVLVESGVRLSPGSATTFQIEGTDGPLVVPARVVRCRVSDVDSLGVKYETAAVFDRLVDKLVADETESRDLDSRLDDLVASIQVRAKRGASPAELRSAFENGIIDLLTAGEVRLRDVPVVENDGRDSVYFTVPTLDDAPAVLQVTFNTNDAPGVEDFGVLSAATGAAAIVLPLTGTARQTSVCLPMPAVAERALELQIA